MEETLELARRQNVLASRQAELRIVEHEIRRLEERRVYLKERIEVAAQDVMRQEERMRA